MINKAIQDLRSEYEKAENNDTIYHTVSYALYQTWKKYKNIESSIEVKEGDVVILQPSQIKGIVVRKPFSNKAKEERYAVFTKDGIKYTLRESMIKTKMNIPDFTQTLKKLRDALEEIKPEGGGKSIEI